MREILNRQNKQFGFSLIELSIVLCVAGIITATIWLGLTAVIQHNITTQAEQELVLVKQGIIGMAHKVPFATATNSVQSLITLGIIPSWAVVSPVQARAPWNNTAATGCWDGVSTFCVYTGLGVAYGLPNNSTFRVAFYNPPTYACIDLILKATNCTAGSQGCPLAIVISDAAAVFKPDAAQGWKLINGLAPVAGAAALCANNPAGSGSIEFDYSL